VALRRRAKLEGFSLIEGTAAWAEPGGLLQLEAFEDLRDEILDQLRAALPVDGVILGLHGAMLEGKPWISESETTNLFCASSLFGVG
jgi:microcystin degradation protein MlrC